MEQITLSHPSKSIELSTPPNAARTLLETFARRGVTAAFGIPGGLISPVYDALRHVPTIRPVTTRHETIAAFASMGHAIATDKPALCLTTGGPGLTNAITGIAAAFAEEIPLVAISGEISRAQTSRATLQDATANSIDAVAMLRTVTRWSTIVDDPTLAVGAAEQAIARACGPRPGPVFLSLPIDVSNGAYEGAMPVALSETQPPAKPDRAACKEAAERLLRARRPLLILGRGARNATEEVAALARRLSIPVMTTSHAKGFFPESHPLHLGIVGFAGHPSAHDSLAAGHDVVIVVGTRLGDWSTNGWTLPVGGSDATIQIDREPWLLGRNYPITLGIVADAGAALRGILAELPLDVARPSVRTGGVRRLHPEMCVSDRVPLNPARVMMGLQSAFPDAFFAVDIGEHCGHALHYLSIDRPDQFRSMVGLASMGSGIGTAIGVRHARRDRPVVSICGDGGFLMFAGEVHTCVDQGIDVVFAVMNDGAYNMINHGFRRVFGRTPECLPSHVADLAGVARDLGAIGVTVETPDDLHPGRLRALAGQGRPVVLDIRFDPSVLALSIESRTASLKKVAFGGAV